MGQGKNIKQMTLLLLGKALLEKYTTPPLSLSLTHYVNVEINENNLRHAACNAIQTLHEQATGDVN